MNIQLKANESTYSPFTSNRAMMNHLSWVCIVFSNPVSGSDSPSWRDVVLLIPPQLPFQLGTQSAASTVQVLISVCPHVHHMSSTVNNKESWTSSSAPHYPEIQAKLNKRSHEMWLLVWNSKQNKARLKELDANKQIKSILHIFIHIYIP